MLSFLIAVIGILITILFVIGTHEFAHFAVARFFNVKVLRFSIGFGKKLWQWRDKKGTEYVLALIPLGGYVKMLDETEDSVKPEDLPYAFNRKAGYKKFLIVLAGPMMNLLCAFIIYWCIFLLGFVTIKPVIGEVFPQSIAASAGLKTGQEIVSIDHEPTLGWAGVLFRLLAHAGNKDNLTIETRTGNTNQFYQLDLSTWHLNELNPDPLNSLGFAPFEPAIPLVIGIITPDSPAANAGLKVGDKLLALNKQAIKNWPELIQFVSTHPEETITLTIERNKQKIILTIPLQKKQSFFQAPRGFLGIAPHVEWPKEQLRHIQYGPLKAIGGAWQQVKDLAYFNFLLIGKMISGKISIQSLGGPITIFESAGTALNSGTIAFLSFLAFLSISIGIINLLPIPGLDGGHLFIYLIEGIIGRPLPDKLLDIFYRTGFLLILFFFFQALINDVLRL